MNLSREEICNRIITALKPFGVRKIALFGSFARADSVANDIDILVDIPADVGLKWFALPAELEELVGMPVDLVSENSLSQSFRRKIAPDLKVIYEKAG